MDVQKYRAMVSDLERDLEGAIAEEAQAAAVLTEARLQYGQATHRREQLQLLLKSFDTLLPKEPPKGPPVDPPVDVPVPVEAGLKLRNPVLRT